MKKIGLALGAGGARGLAQIICLEAFEELGIKPSIIAGSSIGAIIGTIYAAGFDTKEMKEIVSELIFDKNAKFWEIHKKNELLKILGMIDPGIMNGGIIKGNKFISYIESKIGIEKFSELKIPLKIVATNYWTKQQIVLSRGNVLKAMRASYSLPMLFAPVEYNNTILIDGGMVNPLPYDIIKEESDITVAIDVSSHKQNMQKSLPASWEILFSSFQILQNSIVEEKIKKNPPDILIKTKIDGIRVHEFNKVDYIFSKSIKPKDKLKRKLSHLIEKKNF